MACYADAAEYLAQAWSEVKRDVRAAVLAGRDLGDLAAEYVRECAAAGALLDASDVRKTFDHAVNEMRGDEDDEDVWVVRLGAEASAKTLGSCDLPEAKAFGETWRVVEANSEVDAVLKARALDGAGSVEALATILVAWVEEKVAPLAAHLGRQIPA